MVVDASVWVGRLSIGEAHYAASRRWIEEQLRAGEAMVVPVLALAEVAGALARRTGRPRVGHAAVRWMTEVANVRLVALDDQLGSDAARIAADYRLRGADAVYIAVALALGFPLYTWDEEQLTRAAALIPTFRPSN